ncbi:twitching motility protein PilT [Sulfolobus acidocaldarius SUSAZ]|nr:twitching motility protein PilT [Sulfolobus acidocaldarius SUSAZ]
MKAIIDTGVLVEILEGSDIGEKITRLIIQNQIEPLITDLTLTELQYVTCRKYGNKRSSEVIQKLLKSGFFGIVDSMRFARKAAEIKCAHSLSIVDAFNIGAAQELKINAIFKKEKEIDKSISNVVFADEL